MPEGVRYNIAFFHAQQAAEEAVKAVLAFRGVEFERSHSIGYLLGLLPDDVDRPACASEAVALARFAVVSRYPGNYEDIPETDYQEALRTAADIVARARAGLGHG